MVYIPIKNKLQFILAPRINNESIYSIKSALNEFLAFIIETIKQIDYIIHFVDKEVYQHRKKKNEIQVFDTPEEFFKYFKITNMERIIKKLVPPQYLTKFDNSSFDSRIADIINKYKYYDI